MIQYIRAPFKRLEICIVILVLGLCISNFTVKDVSAMYDPNDLSDLSIPQYEKGRLIVRYKDGQSPQELESVRMSYATLDEEAAIVILEKLGGKNDPKSGLFQFESQTYDTRTSKKLLLQNIISKKIVRIQNAISAAKLAEEKIGKMEALGIDYYDYSFREGNIDDKISQFEKLPEVAYAEPKYIYRIQKTPNDPYFERLWGLTKTNAPNAWEKATGDDKVLIAVSDGELDKTHPDLVTNISEVKMFYPCSSGSIWHGTHVSGTIGAIGDNSVGVVGVNWKAKILFMNIGCGRDIDVEAGAESINYAFSKGAKVLNMSWGGTYSALVAESIKKAHDGGMILVAAAGNSEERSPGCADKMYPAKDPNVITVAATDQNDESTSFSCTGNAVDIAAPGFGIYSTVGGGKYRSMDGTSMAAPHVTGLIGLLLSVNPGLKETEIRKILSDTADRVGDSDPKKFGAGRINIGKALAVVAGNDPSTPDSPAPKVTEPESQPQPSATMIKSGTPLELCGESGLYKKFEFVCLDSRKGTIVPENPDECGDEKEMRAEADKACTSLPSAAPEPTGKTLPANVNFKVRLQGVTATPRVNEIKVKIGLKEPNFEEALFQETTIKHIGAGVWEGKAFFNVRPRKDYTFLIKGPFHMQRKFCETTPKELYRGIYPCVDGKLELGVEEVDWDFSTIPLLVGDLPDAEGVQDGIVNARDISQLRQSIDRNDPEILDFCDVNYDGACNVTDFSLLISALSARADEN